MPRQIVTQCLHTFLVGSRQIHTRNLMKAYQVDATLQSLKQSDDLTGMRRRVIEACKADILERSATLVGEIILFQQADHLCNRHLAFGGHQLAALFWQR